MLTIKNWRGQSDVLFYYPGDDNWWLGSYVTTTNQLQWKLVGNTKGFGHAINDGRPFWIGDFNGDGRADVLFYFPGDDNWWLESQDGNQLQWKLVGNTKGFGHAINDGRPFWIGNFSSPNKADVLFYFPGDDNWWLGSYDGNQLQWKLVSNTKGFGHAINDGRPFWIGDFNGDGRADVLFYFPGDDNWWLGSQDGNQLQWKLVGNTKGFGHAINDGRPFWIGNFSSPNKADVLFYFPGDDNWWLGSYDGNQLQWKLVSNTKGFGHAINDGRPFWIGDFNGDGRADVLFYFPGDDNWWLGSYVTTTNQLQWKLVGNTKGFGHAINDGRPFWIGNFSSPNKADVLFYFPGDDNWWLGSHNGNQLQWKLVGNTKGFGHAINDGRPFWIGNCSSFNSSYPNFYHLISELPTKPKIESTNCKGGMLWTNYPLTQSITPYSTCRPNSLAGIVVIIREAEAAHKHVHAFGSKWSFSDCAFTHDYVVDTRDLNRKLLTEEELKRVLKPGLSLRLYHVEAGITIRNLYEKLNQEGLALETMGGASGQTLAGAISTGTHGS